jgi:hypothetical protein
MKKKQDLTPNPLDLRDYFAGQYLAGATTYQTVSGKNMIKRFFGIPYKVDHILINSLIKNAYLYADALVAERARTIPQKTND